MRRRRRTAAAILSAVLFANGGLPRAAGADLAGDEAVAAARALRAGGCEGRAGTSAPLHHDAALDLAARHWSRDGSLRAALGTAGFPAVQSAGVHVSGELGELGALRGALAPALCRSLTDPAMTNVGVWSSGRDLWLIVAARFAPPRYGSPAVMQDLVDRINAARSRARRCGHRMFAAAPPLRLDTRLAHAAAAHADDMLARNYFDHRSPDGSTPAMRVTAAGYPHSLVGENIAEGPEDAAGAIDGWLASPGHCENIMQPRFRDTGFGYASSLRGEPRIYWVEEFATPP